MPDAPYYSHELLNADLEMLARCLGPAWDEIVARDRTALLARRREADRHLLAVLVEHSHQFDSEYGRIVNPRRFADVAALHAMVATLARAREEPSFGEIAAQLAVPEAFRHHMTLLGFRDLILTYTQYEVELPRSETPGERVVDLTFGPHGGPRVFVEVKAPKSLARTQTGVTHSLAQGALNRVWRDAFRGPSPQVPPERVSFLILGALTISLPDAEFVAREARGLLGARGSSHPNLWGVLVLTYRVTTVLPPGRSIGDGMPVDVEASAGVLFREARNPYYRGNINVQLTATPDGVQPLD